MTADRTPEATTLEWSRVESVFHAALAVSLPERDAWLARTCGADQKLRAAVQRLLEADTGAGAFLTQPALGGGFGIGNPEALIAEPERRQIGPYQLIRLLGSGGMGNVWLARRDDEHFQMDVAIKILRRGMDTDEALARFRQERQLLARLEHPNIARLLDGGTTDDGSPFLVMEYIDGLPIDRYCQEHQLDLYARLRLFQEVCAAVQYAHQNLVIHRDLKPDNIPVTADGRPRLLDFGIAKVLQFGSSAQVQPLAVTEGRLLTPDYASPEQIRGAAITTASDVYSLGVVLFELLTLQKPHSGVFHTRGELERAVCDVDSLAPSTVVRRAGARSSGAATQMPVIRAGWPEGEAIRLSRRLRGDLDSIVLTALHKDPNKRYASAERFAEDIERSLNGQPITARLPTWRYRAGKFMGRHWIGVAAAATTMLSMIIGLFLSARGYALADRARQAEAIQRQIAESKSAEAQEQRQAAERKAYVASLAGAEASLRAQDVMGARLSLAQAPSHLRNWEWNYFAKQLDQSLHVIQTPDVVYGLAVSPDGGLLAATCRDGSVHVWDTTQLEPVFAARGQYINPGQLAFSPDGRLLAYSDRRNIVQIWDVVTATVRASLAAQSQPITSIAFSLDGARLACGCIDGTICIWTWSASQTESMSTVLATGAAQRVVWKGHDGGVAAVEFDSSGRWLASGGADSVVRIWDATLGCEEHSFRGHAGSITAVGFSPAASRLVSSSQDGLVKTWDLENGRELLSIHQHDAIVSAARFSPDGAQVASASWDRTVRVWDAVTGEPLAKWLGHTDNITSLAYSPDGLQLYSGAADRTIRIWNVLDRAVLAVRGRSERVNNFACGQGGHWIAACYGNGHNHGGFVSFWDERKGHELAILYTNQVVDAQGRRHELNALSTSADGRWLAAESGDGSILVWKQPDLDKLQSEAAEGHHLELPVPFSLADGIEPPGRVFSQAIAFAPDGRLLIAGRSDGTLRVWDVEQHTLVRRDAFTGEWITCVAFAPQGEWYAVGLSKGGARAFSALTGTELARVGTNAVPVRCVAVSPDGKWLALGLLDASIQFYDTAKWQQVFALTGHAQSVRCLAFSPDGIRLATGSDDRKLKLWDLASQQEVATIHGHGYLISAVEWDSTGQSILSSSADGTLRIWDANANR